MDVFARGTAEAGRRKSKILRGAVLPERRRLPAPVSRPDHRDASWLRERLGVARELIVHDVAAALCSVAALLAHRIGTEAARTHSAITGHVRPHAGSNMITQAKIWATKRPSVSLYESPLPSWLSEDQERAQACEQVAAIYEQVTELAGLLADAREQSKAHAIKNSARQHRLLLALRSPAPHVGRPARAAGSSRNGGVMTGEGGGMASGSHLFAKRKATFAFRLGQHLAGHHVVPGCPEPGLGP